MLNTVSVNKYAILQESLTLQFEYLHYNVEIENNS